MHILFITHYFAPDSGAAANRLTRLAHRLQQRGHQVTVLTTLPHYPKGIITEGYRGHWQVIEDREGVRVIQTWLWTTTSTSVSRRLLSQLSFMATCALRGLFVKQPDVIFIENQPIFTGLAGWFIGKVRRRGYVLNVSDHWPEYLHVAGIVSETSLIYRLFKAMTNMTQTQADGIVALTRPLLEGVKKRIGEPKRSRVIHNSVDMTKFRPGTDDHAFRQKHELGDARLVTFLGVLGPHIDLDTMLAAARQLHGRDDVRFLFVGTGTQKDALADAMRQPEYAHCRWIDWLDYSEMPGFWAASYINYWALHDNPLDKMRFQAKLYEAMATGTPVVVGVEGLMSDVLGETGTGVTVPHGDADALAAEIIRLLDDDAAYIAIGERARAYAEANFDVERAVDAYEALLREVSRSP